MKVSIVFGFVHHKCKLYRHVIMHYSDIYLNVLYIYVYYNRCAHDRNTFGRAGWGRLSIGECR